METTEENRNAMRDWARAIEDKELNKELILARQRLGAAYRPQVEEYVRRVKPVLVDNYGPQETTMEYIRIIFRELYRKAKFNRHKQELMLEHKQLENTPPFVMNGYRREINPDYESALQRMGELEREWPWLLKPQL